MPLVPFKLPILCWSSEGVSRVSPRSGPLKRTAWNPSSFFYQLNPCWFLQSDIMGTYLPDTRTLGCGGAGMGLGPLIPEISLQIFIHHMWVQNQPIPCLHISTPPTSLDECRFFNSEVVRLPFSWISDSPEQWWFYSLVVILMCLFKEANHIYPCFHLDWKSWWCYF